MDPESEENLAQHRTAIYSNTEQPAEPEAEARAEDALVRRALRNPNVRLLVLAGLFGGGWAVDAPGAVAGLFGKAPHREEAAAPLSPTELGRVLPLTPDYVLLKARVDQHEDRFKELAALIRETNEKLQKVIDQNNRTEGAAAALREERRNR